ncbi:hypothetical protein, partial [Oenococcus oeni]|uniref:hypothetical protein n=1 Tax=Oenococcus oeni TaxID=1247 RepID=UPI001C5A8A9D
MASPPPTSWTQRNPMVWNMLGSIGAGLIGAYSGRSGRGYNDTASWEARRWQEQRYDIERTHGREDMHWAMEMNRKYAWRDRQHIPYHTISA